ncbi:hypothetical protein IRJ41_005816 [Triplophysa rosa]|uniref:Uncharacterized protein n=1 Tax=Triplophysa rosa TaxID=992332 RepID=A0A9W7WGL4_TRIRA|nr:hypothetical protein IRJ41_005816 [Triplophysa rosa]
MNELNPLCVKLGIKCLNERENLFLQEYCTMMKPLTVALDILQGDECTYGDLLPTLTSLMSKTLALKDYLSRMTASLPDVIVKKQLWKSKRLMIIDVLYKHSTGNITGQYDHTLSDITYTDDVCSLFHLIRHGVNITSEDKCA